MLLLVLQKLSSYLVRWIERKPHQPNSSFFLLTQFICIEEDKDGAVYTFWAVEMLALVLFLLKDRSMMGKFKLFPEFHNFVSICTDSMLTQS